jgi:hypothetical protein
LVAGVGGSGVESVAAIHTHSGNMVRMTSGLSAAYLFGLDELDPLEPLLRLWCHDLLQDL